MITRQVGNPGLAFYRKQTLTTLDAVCQVKASIFQLLLRNAATSPVYLNIYDRLPQNVTVGGLTPTVPLTRIMVPAAIDGSNPGQLIITSAEFPLWYFDAGITIAPVTTDADSAAVGGTLYAEITYAAADTYQPPA